MGAPQGTVQWLQEKLGKVGGSKAKATIARTKSGWSQAREDLMMTLLAERLSGNPEEVYVSKAMQWGTDKEPLAKLRYKELTGFGIVEVGFIPHPTLRNTGASPDGIVEGRLKLGERDGLIEVKCPNTATHIENLSRGSHDPQYEAQMTLQMLCALDDPWTNGGWCDMVSFDPRMPEPLDICINRYEFDPVFAKELEDGIRLFEQELNGTVLSFLKKFPDLEKDYRSRWMGEA